MGRTDPRRRKAITMALEGVSRRKIAIELRASSDTVQGWLWRASQAGAVFPPPRLGRPKGSLGAGARMYVALRGQGLTYAEIGRLMGVTQQAASSRCRNATAAGLLWSSCLESEPRESAL